MTKKILPLLAAALLLAGCHRGGIPADVLTEQQMVDFLADAYLLEGFYAIETQYRYDVVTPDVLRQYDSILAVHHLTRDEVERSLDYYTQHLDRYQAIQDSVVSRLEAATTNRITSAPTQECPISPRRGR